MVQPDGRVRWKHILTKAAELKLEGVQIVGEGLEVSEVKGRA